jgi:hypothetical protein
MLQPFIQPKVMANQRQKMVMFNIGKGANDATCTVFGAPHLIVGSLPMSSERIFSSGNERTTTFFNPPVRIDHFDSTTRQIC